MNWPSRLLGGRVGRKQAGFTLIEVLVALVVLGFVMAGLADGVRLGMRAWDQQAREVDSHGELDAVDRALRRLVEAADPGDRTRAAGIAGDAGTLRLLTVLPQAAGGQESEVAVGEARGRLLLRWRPYSPGVRVQPAAAPEEVELLRGVESVRFAYFGPDGWRDGWDRPDPPMLVRIRLRFAGDAAARHWPDLVAAPARARER